MTDHKAKAEHIATTGADGGEAYMIEGLIHATLALVEQQRVANLIAAFQHFGWRNVLNADPIEGEELPEPLRALLGIS